MPAGQWSPDVIPRCAVYAAGAGVGSSDLANYDQPLCFVGAIVGTECVNDLASLAPVLCESRQRGGHRPLAAGAATRGAALRRALSAASFTNSMSTGTRRAWRATTSYSRGNRCLNRLGIGSGMRRS